MIAGQQDHRHIRPRELCEALGELPLMGLVRVARFISVAGKNGKLVSGLLPQFDQQRRGDHFRARLFGSLSACNRQVTPQQSAEKVRNGQRGDSSKQIIGV